ncbi:hypothetical protein AB0G79_16280 [Streptomyces sp. NPDC020807]|uniref:hypothetical protein n=1 Tax=Streptomyces sp. NPDC020807 TaxID=3155119 RepID=UPI0033CD53D3
MTPTSSLPAVRRALRVLAIGACLPYIVLKAVWIAGGELGIPAGSPLLDHPVLMAVANTLTLLADAAVIALAVLLTRERGPRIPDPLLVLPTWAATGLLAPIATGFPAQLLAGLLTADAPAADPSDSYLDPWVFGVVYGGFILQGLALGVLFLLYARDRWGRVWRGRLGEVSARVPGPGVRAAALAGTALAAVTAVLQAGRLAEAGDVDQAIVEALRLAFLFAAAVSTLLLVRRRPARLDVRPVLAAAWVSTGAVGCWGAYLTLVSFQPAGEAVDTITALARLSYAGQMITGFLLAACLAVFLRRRSAEA